VYDWKTQTVFGYDKKIVSIFLAVIIMLSLCACSKQETADTEKLENMTTEDNGSYVSIIWDGRTYVPYSAISKGDCGEQIGIINGDENDKVYAYENCSTEMWIAEMYVSGLMDAPMLFREINVTEIPEGLQSEYEWNLQ
jgi:hypothetical protein